MSLRDSLMQTMIQLSARSATQFNEAERRFRFFFIISEHADGEAPRTRVNLKVPQDASRPRPFRRPPLRSDRARRRLPSACAEKVVKIDPAFSAERDNIFFFGGGYLGACRRKAPEESAA